MGEYRRDLLPDAESYHQGTDSALTGPGAWGTKACPFHGGSDSMRVNRRSGGWRCMACGEKGGDVLDFHRELHGLDFIEAARALGAYVEDGMPHRGRATPTTLPAREAMELAAMELKVALVVISDIRRGVIPSDADWLAYLEAAGQVETLAMEYRT
jgi:DNA primase